MTANAERLFSDRPEVYAAWVDLNTSIKHGMDLRRYELVTLAAARRLRSSYCCLAHGKVLLQKFDEPVRDIALDHRSAGLDEVDVAVMDFAEKIVDDASEITEADHQKLRELGLTEKDILDVTLAATARCFFSKTLDAMRVQADPHYEELDDDLKEALIVGRPIAKA
jgi:alkylhydroperoxidase family enzyme